MSSGGAGSDAAGRILAIKGYLFALISVMLFTAEAGLARTIGPEINAAQVPAFRCVLQIAVLGILIRGQFVRHMRSSRIGGHLWRGALSGVGSAAYFYVFANLPLGIATVIFFTSVLFTTALAGPVLAEKVGWRRWSATAVGFVGILLVVRPGAIPFDFALAVAFLLALNAAAINLSTKGLTRTEGTLTIMLWICLSSALVLLPWAALTWTWPTPRVVVLMTLIAVVGMVGQYFSITSYRYADASGLAPILYLRIVLSAFAGWWIFGERFDLTSIAGTALITASAVYITWREGQLRRMADREAQAQRGTGA